MSNWTLTAKLPGTDNVHTESFEGEFAWCDARDALVDNYLADLPEHDPKREALSTLLCDGNPDEVVHLSIDGVTVTLVPTDEASPAYPPLMHVIDALPAQTDEDYSWDERSSITSCAIALLEKLAPSTRHAAAEDVLDHFAEAGDDARYAVSTVDNATFIVLDKQHDLEVAVCSTYLVDGEEVENDNAEERATLIARGLNLIGADLKAPEAPGFSFLVTNGTYIELTAQNDAARRLIDGKNSIEDLPDSDQVVRLLDTLASAGGHLLDDCDGEAIDIAEFRSHLAEMMD